MTSGIHIANLKLKLPDKKVRGSLVTLQGNEYYLIENYDMMDPFLMSIVSNSDHWMFISSTGGLTAGRRNPDVAIFPYYTDDKIHESHLTTGSKTVIISGAGDKRQIWEPFSDFQRGIYDVQCNLYKNVPGNRVVFEEINRDLELIYRYSWMNSEKYGWIRKSTLINQSERVVNVSLLDGLRNILPYGVSQKMQNELSTLVDAYKKTELDINTGLGIFRLASIPVDRAMPSEALKCTSVWFTGYKPLAVLLEEKQLKNFRMTGACRPEKSSKGVRGCYFTVADRELKAREELEAYYVVELEQDAADVEALVSLLGSNTDLPDMLDKDVDLGTKKLNQLVGMSDGIQQSADRMSNIRHFSNVLFNLMRGGLFENSYDIIRDHFAGHLEKYNRKLYAEYNKFLKNLPESISLDKLLEKVKEREDNRLLRLSMEYLPLSFSRRHGDPSRPWNRFDIRLKEDDGTPSYSYQGNWRDIFQNWEALALSFPGFLPSMISRFLNSSTADGHNPYRISSDGIDWEVPEPDNPWSYIGYWGDHQVIYLLRLLEMLYNYRPEQVDEWLDHRIFSYANIPYRIKKYDEIVENPYDTIVFDAGKNREIDKLTEIYGADGKMLMGEDGHVLMASFTEKIMVSLLSRIVNFIPDTGIWMNTQRPEWNDANNALVGNGASMVTLYYLRRMTGFLMKLFAGATNKNYKIRKEIVNLFNTLNKVLKRHSENLVEGIDDKLRKKISDDLGRAGTEYRESVYQGFSGDYGTLDRDELTGFLQIVSACIDSSIWNNRREDGLFNAYNLVDISGSSIKIITLEEMLEGQVAMLSSGLLTPAGAGELIERMFESKLYRADQNSFMLYPDKELKSFRSNNNIDREEISGSVLLKQLADKGDRSVIIEDINGNFHFNGTFRNSEDLFSALDHLGPEYGKVSEKEKSVIANIFESVFQHKKFTGRSGSFYKYEGLGSIYWHMVSKMLLAAGEYITRAYDQGSDKETFSRLCSLYYRVRSGIGVDKSPSDYGAFPADPYSHTPSMAGVQQPGMTGQVKEDIISRYIELGLRIEGGRLSFMPVLLRKNEFIKNENGNKSLAFTVCGTPVKYTVGEKLSANIIYKDNREQTCEKAVLNTEQSHDVLQRSGLIQSINVFVTEDQLIEI